MLYIVLQLLLFFIKKKKIKKKIGTSFAISREWMKDILQRKIRNKIYNGGILYPNP